MILDPVGQEVEIGPGASRDLVQRSALAVVRSVEERGTLPSIICDIEEDLGERKACFGREWDPAEPTCRDRGSSRVREGGGRATHLAKCVHERQACANCCDRLDGSR